MKLLAALALVGAPCLAAQDPPVSTADAGDPSPAEPADVIAGRESPPSPHVDDRLRELVRRDCSTRLGRREVTLFANGTVRLKRWSEAGEMTMFLAELGPGEVEGFENRFAEFRFGETPEAQLPGVSGEWVERCELRVDSRSLHRNFRFGTLDTFDLALGSLIHVVDELEALAASQAVSSELPAAYSPRRGDRLLRSDGVEFEVAGFTVVGDGVELRGVTAPLTIYVAKADLRRLFRRLVATAP